MCMQIHILQKGFCDNFQIVSKTSDLVASEFYPLHVHLCTFYSPISIVSMIYNKRLQIRTRDPYQKLFINFLVDQQSALKKQDFFTSNL